MLNSWFNILCENDATAQTYVFGTKINAHCIGRMILSHIATLFCIIVDTKWDTYICHWSNSLKKFCGKYCYENASNFYISSKQPGCHSSGILFSIIYTFDLWSCDKKYCLYIFSCVLFILTSISSLYLSRGASMMLRSLNVSVSTSKVCPVTLTQNQIDSVEIRMSIHTKCQDNSYYY